MACYDAPHALVACYSPAVTLRLALPRAPGALWCSAAHYGAQGALTAILGLLHFHASRDAAWVIVCASDFGDYPPPSCVCYPLDGPKEI